VLRAEGQLVGLANLRRQTAEARQADIGYELAPVYWGQGYATEAARELVRFGFQELHLHRLWASCNAENQASARVLAKAGMKPEGRLRENEWTKHHVSRVIKKTRNRACSVTRLSATLRLY
jgi:RimJ/RimL family protein N-acetyltransferase